MFWQTSDAFWSNARIVRGPEVLWGCYLVSTDLPKLLHNNLLMHYLKTECKESSFTGR